MSNTMRLGSWSLCTGGVISPEWAANLSRLSALATQPTPCTVELYKVFDARARGSDTAAPVNYLTTEAARLLGERMGAVPSVRRISVTPAPFHLAPFAQARIDVEGPMQVFAALDEEACIAFLTALDAADSPAQVRWRGVLMRGAAPAAPAPTPAPAPEPAQMAASGNDTRSEDNLDVHHISEVVPEVEDSSSDSGIDVGSGGDEVGDLGIIVDDHDVEIASK